MLGLSCFHPAAPRVIDFGVIAYRVAEAIVEEIAPDAIVAESDFWEGRGGTSAEVRHLGLRPAFRYRLTGEVFYDPDMLIHLSTTVPREFWAEVDAEGDLKRFVPGIEQGFVFPEDPTRFFTRAEAAEAAGMAAVTASVSLGRPCPPRPHPISRG